ncbi:iron ABC transporter permease [Streptomyces sp. MP131-18]|uniref:FecCD family ABC transporter permease n=1 Tax=Streptomyces sp. MP131-18 TaxID=1857892 RepID=UPI0009A1834D|nr:iron ABC transporter permease [Streptomyces sp. MP131-18]ONK13580.1 putative siderophore transport system permease protein YfiZ precursor [Streptomyces sp. MP131-18]
MPAAAPPSPAVQRAVRAPSGGGAVRRSALLAAATAAVALAALLSLALGSRSLAPGEVWQALIGQGEGAAAKVVRELRVPRTVIGLMVGAALGMAGAVMQGLTRNPIAEPGLLGVSQGASVGVVLAIAFAGAHSLDAYVWYALAGAALAGVGVYAVASRGRGGASPVKLALSGAAVNALLASVTAGVLTTRATTLEQFRFWQIGSLSGRDASIAADIWPFLLGGTLLVIAAARGLDALALGDDVARGLGQNVALVRVTGGLGAVVLAGAAVAAAGPIAFVGLTVPHLARGLVGGGHRWLLPMSALLGAVMLLVADVVARLVFPPSEVPSGVMTALIGVPFLVVLVRRSGVRS